jgi:hypothetical protein
MAHQSKSLISVSYPRYVSWLILSHDTVSAGIIEGANDGRGRGRQGAYKDGQYMYSHYVLHHDILAVIAGVVTYLDLIGTRLT